MGETHQHNHQQSNHHHQTQQRAANTSRVGMRNPNPGGGGGEIVKVQGGHIVRSTGRKDRHSKVCTAKGPRDRRVRLSAHTAIQFYDVQDRLGYDRPSKAVDWLIKKAKAAIDELAELPPWKPTTTLTPTPTTTDKAPQGEEEETTKQQQQQRQRQQQRQQQESSGSDKDYNNSNNIQMDSFQISFQNQQAGSGFLPPSLDSDAIADTIKSFFPMGAAGGGEAATPPSGNSIQQFQTYPAPDLLSRTSSSGGHNQDLRLSLQSFQEPHQVVFPGPGSGAAHFLGGGFDGSSSSGGGWSEQHQNPVEISRFQRMISAWNAGGGGGDNVFNSMPPPSAVAMQPMFGQNHHQLVISQRGPLQSSNSPSVRAWIDPGVGIADQILQFHPGMGFGGFPRFHVPARIQGDQEELDGIHNKPSSASSDSRH